MMRPDQSLQPTCYGLRLLVVITAGGCADGVPAQQISADCSRWLEFWSTALTRGTVVAVDQTVSRSGRAQTQTLPELPLTLHGYGRGDRTMYRLRINFVGPLPHRFDLSSPQVMVGGTTYDVPKFRYRYFAERGEYGLCI